MKKIEQNQNDSKSHILMLVSVNQLYKRLDKKPYTLRQKSNWLHHLEVSTLFSIYYLLHELKHQQYQHIEHHISF